MRRLLVVAAIGIAAVLSGCSSTDNTATTAPSLASGSTPGTTGATTTSSKTTGTQVPKDGGYCAIVTRINASTSKKGSTPGRAEIDAVLTDMRAARDAGPGDLAKSWNTLIDVADELGGLDSTNDADSSKALALIFDPEFQAAVDDVSGYTQKQCGFKLEGFSDDSKGTGSNQKPTGTIAGTDGLPSVCRNIGKISDDDDKDKTSLYSVRVGVCKAHPDASWLGPVVVDAGWASMNAIDWTITVPTDTAPAPDVSAADAVDACKAIADYLAGAGTDPTITIGTGPMGEPKPATVLATRTAGGTCAAA